MKPKLVFLSRYQNKVDRGAETFVAELASRLTKDFAVSVLPDFSLSAFWRLKPDIVIPVNGGGQAFLTKLYCLLTGVKMIISGQAGLGRPDRINLLLRPNLFVALTARNAAWAKKYAYGVPIEVIANGVDLARFKPEGKKIDLGLPGPVVICAAGPESYKRVKLTIEAVSRVPSASLLLVGGSSSDRQLGQQLLPGRFLAAKYPHEQMPAVYRAGQVFTLASASTEAFGIAYLEALASGLPVVAPDDQLRREILGPHGIYVDNIENVNQYAEALNRALKLNRPRAGIWLKHFSWDHIAHKYRLLCLKLLSQ